MAARPSPENSTTIPRQNTTACILLPLSRFRKNETVMGTMGKTQGVKIAASPKPNATSKNGARPPEACGCTAPGRASLNPAGMLTAAIFAAGSMVTAAVTVSRPGTHSLSLHVW